HVACLAQALQVIVRQLVVGDEIVRVLPHAIFQPADRRLARVRIRGECRSGRNDRRSRRGGRGEREKPTEGEKRREQERKEEGRGRGGGGGTRSWEDTATR